MTWRKTWLFSTMSLTHLDKCGVEVDVMRHDNSSYNAHCLHQGLGVTTRTVGKEHPFQQLTLIWLRYDILIKTNHNIASQCHLVANTMQGWGLLQSHILTRDMYAGVYLYTRTVNYFAVTGALLICLSMQQTSRYIRAVTSFLSISCRWLLDDIWPGASAGSWVATLWSGPSTHHTTQTLKIWPPSKHRVRLRGNDKKSVTTPNPQRILHQPPTEP